MEKRENDTGKKIIKLNLPQLIIANATQPDIVWEGGRGGGKSTSIADRIKNLVHQMPRASGVIVGETYGQILTRTLPSTISGLERLGYYKDYHYFIGRKPPKSWKWNEPYEPPANYDHYMIWYTGAGFHLVSQDRSGSGRGLNTDFIIGDEAALLDFEKLFNDVLATNRGNLHRFSNCPLHHSTFFCSTTPMTTKGKWMFKIEEEAKQNPDKILYLRSSATHNINNLGKKFFSENKKRLPRIIYDAEILNIRPGKIEGGFYPQFSEKKHTHVAINYNYMDSMQFSFKENGEMDCRQDADLLLDAPIDIAMDYGASINVIVSGQMNKNAYKVLNCLFLKTPHLVPHVVEKFCAYYKYHRNKTVNYYYDHTAIGHDGGRAETYEEQVTNTLAKNGWKVNKQNLGQAPAHDTKYRFWGRVLSEESNYPHVTFNRNNCKYLIISIHHAPVKQTSKGFEKDKGSERKADVDQAEATHPSDACDTLIFGVLKNYRRPPAEHFEPLYG